MAKFQVYFEQINQSCVKVEAKTIEEAVEKATRKWRKEEGHPRTTYVENLDTKTGHRPWGPEI